MADHIANGYGDGNYPLRINPDGSINTSAGGVALSEQRSYTASNQVEYIGQCDPALANNGSNVWRIQKWTYTSNLLTSITWASGTGGIGVFDKDWTNRATHTYK